MSVTFIVWVILTVLLLIYPVSLCLKYIRLGGKKVVQYIVKHTQEMKAIRQFHQGDLINKIKESEKNDDTNIFDEKPNAQKENIEDESAGEMASDNDDLSNNGSNKSEVQEIPTEPTPERIANTINKEIKSYDVSKESKEEIHKRKVKLDKIKAQAEMYKNKAQFEEYEKKLVEGMSLEESPKGYFKQNLADWYFHMGNFKKSLTLLKQILAADPRHHKSLWQVGEIHLEKGEFEIAEMLTQKAIDLSPQNPKYYVSMVEILYNKGMVQDAIGLMHKVIKLRPKNISYLTGLAGLHENVKEDQEAKSVYMKILQLDPSNEKARKKLKLLT